MNTGINGKHETYLAILWRWIFPARTYRRYPMDAFYLFKLTTVAVWSGVDA
jgi:hypothetical protein